LATPAVPFCSGTSLRNGEPLESSAATCTVKTLLVTFPSGSVTRTVICEVPEVAPAAGLSSITSF
jgi:hypothetical protein